MLPPFPLDASCLCVAFVAGAEVATMRVLGWPMPERIFDLFQELRVVTNTGRKSDPRGLETGCAHYGIAMMEHAAKKRMQMEAQIRLDWPPELRAEMIEYCFEDGLATARLFLCVLAQWLEIHAGDEERQLHHALRRGRYAGVMAEAELRGIPFHMPDWNVLRDGRETVFSSMVDDLAPALRPIYRDTQDGPHFTTDVFEQTMHDLGLTKDWPRTNTGLLSRDKDMRRPCCRSPPSRWRRLASRPSIWPIWTKW